VSTSTRWHFTLLS